MNSNMNSIENKNTVRLVKLKRNKYYKTFINDSFVGGLYLKDFEAVGLKKPRRKKPKAKPEESVYDKYKIRRGTGDHSDDPLANRLNDELNNNSNEISNEITDRISESASSEDAFEILDDGEIILNDISDNVVEDIEEVIYLRAFDKSLDYLSRSEVSASGIRSKLRLKDYSDGIIDKVIEELYARNYLNDTRFVESYVRSYMRSKSKRLIMKELENIGIDTSECGAIVDGVYEDEGITEDEVIEGLLRKKYTKEQLKDIKVKRRAMSYLGRHGFSFDTINNYLT